MPGIGIITNVVAILLGGLLGLPHIRVANFLPALVIAVLWQGGMKPL